MSRGLYFMVFAVCLLALQQVAVKLLSGMPVYQIVFFRALASFIISAIVLKKNGQSFKGENYPLLLFRGMVGTLSLLTFFYTLHHIPLATAVTIGHISPLFLGILAYLFLKEKFTIYNWMALLICFAGVLVIKGFDLRIGTFDLAVAVFSAMLAGIAHFSVRLLRNENPLNVLFYFSLVMMVLLFPTLLFTWETPDFNEWMILLVTGFISHYAQLFLTKSLKEEEVSKVGGVYYLGIVFALVIGVVFFGESFNAESLLGMALIMTGFMLDFFIRKVSVWTKMKNAHLKGS